MKLGCNQIDVLKCLAGRHGAYHRGCGWVWDTDSGTVRILESLIRHNLVEKQHHPGFHYPGAPPLPYPVFQYSINQSGLDWLRENKSS